MNTSLNSLKVEFVNKKWKQVKLIAIITIVVGIVLWTLSSSDDFTFNLGISFTIVGIITLAIGIIGAWYDDGLAR